MPIKHWDLMETSRPGHPQKSQLWKQSWKLRDAAVLGMSLLLVYRTSDAGLGGLTMTTQHSQFIKQADYLCSNQVHLFS